MHTCLNTHNHTVALLFQLYLWIFYGHTLSKSLCLSEHTERPLSLVSVLVCTWGQRLYSQSGRWGEMASPAEVDAEPPEPSELMQELLSGHKGCVWAMSDGEDVAACSGSCSRLLDFISFFNLRVIQFPRLREGTDGKEERNKTQWNTARGLTGEGYLGWY